MGLPRGRGPEPHLRVRLEDRHPAPAQRRPALRLRVRPEPEDGQAQGGRHPHADGLRRAHAARPARHQPAGPGGGAGHPHRHGPRAERRRPAVRRDPPRRRHPRLVGGRHAQPGGPAGADGHGGRRHRVPGPGSPARSPTSSTTPSTRSTPPSTGAQLQVQQLEPQFNDTIAAGNVISLNPPAGTQVARDSVGAGRGVAGSRDRAAARPEGADRRSGEGGARIAGPRRWAARAVPPPHRCWPQARRRRHRSSGARPSTSSWVDRRRGH